MKLRLALLAVSLGLLLFPGARAEPSPFEGTWLGEIAAPNTRTPLGLAFTPTPKGLFVHLYFPEMFLHGVNFGPAEIHGDTFTLDALNLAVTRDGDTLTGTFAIAKLPVTLHRGGKFDPAPPEPVFPAAPAPAWSHALGAPAWASPIARDGVVYVGTTDGKFHAVRAADGAAVWTWSGPHPLWGEAVAAAELVCFVDEHTELVALDRATGVLRWRVPLHDEKLAGGPPPKNETFNHRAIVPVLDAKRATLYAGSTDGGLYAVRADTGKILWRHAAPAKIYAPVTLQGDTILAAAFDGTVFALDRRSRKETLRAKVGGPVVSAPVVVGDRIVVGARDYLLYGLDRATGAIVWRDSYWFSWVESSARVADGTVYIGGSDFRRVSALDPATGRTLWATDVRGLTWGSPVVTADTVFAGAAGQNIEGTVIQHTGGIVALARATGAVKWRYTPTAPAGADFTGFAGSLVSVEGKIVGAGVDGTLLAFPVN